jgi:hypothetical protein
VGILQGDSVTWFWIGNHDDYERFSSNQAGAGFLDGWFQAITVSEPAPTSPGILPISQELKTYILSNT